MRLKYTKIRLKYTKEEAIELGERNIKYDALCTVGLEETADIFWKSWHNNPENKFVRIVTSTRIT